MNPPSLWDRLRRTRAVQVTVAYLAASWFVLQFVATVQEMLALPAWVGPVTIVLLVVGLFVVGATAWIQSLDRTTAGEEAGELPTDWEIAPSDALESLRAGRLPHLTWGRAILGGVVSISLMIGVAGGYVLLSEGVERIGPSPAGASAPAEGIAVLPFTVSGTGLEAFAEGMVSLVSTNIDGVDGLHSVNPRTVMAQWEESFGEARSVALDQALRAAGATGARYAVLGDAVSTGPSVRLTAELYDLDSGERIGAGRSEGPTDDVLGLIDEMSIDVLRALLVASGRQGSTGIQRLDGLVTSSIEALTAYLEGEAHFREGRTTAALESYEHAVDIDSTFALAWSRIGTVHGWLATEPGAAREARARAAAFVDRLPERDVTLVRAYADITNAIPTEGTFEALRQHVRRHRDDPEGWAVLGEYYLHLPGVLYTREELEEALESAVDLDPGFAPYYIHLLRYQVRAGDWRFFEYMERYRGVVSEERAAAYQRQWDFHHGSGDARAEAEAWYAERPRAAIPLLYEVILGSDSIAERNLQMVRLMLPEQPGAGALFGEKVLGNLGRFSELPGGEARAAEPDAGTLDLTRLATAVLTDEPLGALTPVAAADRIGEWVIESQPFVGSEAPGPDQARRQEIARAELEALVSAAHHLVEGAPEEALRVMDATPSRGGLTDFFGWWDGFYAEALARSGRPREAARHYEVQLHSYRAVGRLRLGELYEELGDTERARENYEGFLRLYRNADETTAGLVERGRAGLQRVGGDAAASGG